MKPLIEAFFDTDTETISYVVADEQQQVAAIIDPVLNYDPKSGEITTVEADRIVAFVQAKSFKVEWILETHAHADHLSAAQYLKSRLGGQVAIGENIRLVQQVFKQKFNLDGRFQCDGSQFDRLLAEGESIRLGQYSIKVLFVPGHTPADSAYQIEDAVFVGDTLFLPDVGTARCDFPGGDAHNMYHSIQQLLALPDSTRLFMCHDYPPDGRQHAWQTTVAEQKLNNIHVRSGISEQAFVDMREERDAGLAMPCLIYPSIQMNIRAGSLPPVESNGQSYFKIPVAFKFTQN